MWLPNPQQEQFFIFLKIKPIHPHIGWEVHVTTQRAKKTEVLPLINNSVVSLAMKRDRGPVSDTEWTHRHPLEQ